MKYLIFILSSLLLFSCISKKMDNRIEAQNEKIKNKNIIKSSFIHPKDKNGNIYIVDKSDKYCLVNTYDKTGKKLIYITYYSKTFNPTFRTEYIYNEKGKAINIINTSNPSKLIDGVLTKKEIVNFPIAEMLKDAKNRLMSRYNL